MGFETLLLSVEVSREMVILAFSRCASSNEEFLSETFAQHALVDIKTQTRHSHKWGGGGGVLDLMYLKLRYFSQICYIAYFHIPVPAFYGNTINYVHPY